LGLKHIVRYYKFNKNTHLPNQYDFIHRELSNQCIKFGFENVLIIDDEAILKNQLKECIKDITENLQNSNWYSFEIAWHELGLYTSTVYNYSHEIPLDSSKSCYMFGYNLKHTFDLSWEMHRAKGVRELHQNPNKSLNISHTSGVINE
jgi:hypothetical protein